MYGIHHRVGWGFIEYSCCCARLVLFIVDRAVQLWILDVELFLETKDSGACFYFYYFFKQNKNVEQLPLGSATRMIYSPHTRTPCCKQRRDWPTLFLSSPNRSPSLSVFSLIQSLCHSSQHNASYIPILSLPRSHIYTRTLPYTPTSLPRVP